MGNGHNCGISEIFRQGSKNFRFGGGINGGGGVVKQQNLRFNRPMPEPKQYVAAAHPIVLTHVR